MRELIIKDFNNQVCIFQLTNLKDMDRINTYLKSLQDGSIILLGEYVINDFIGNANSIANISKDSKENLEILKAISKDYKHTIVAPFIQCKNKSYYKNMAVITQGKLHSYQQQRLINFTHWNEAEFFSNDVSKLIKLPLTFIANNIRFGVLFGFEAHFDEFWTEFKKADVDVILASSASTFSSHIRWRNLFSTHAFTNSCYVFRANRIGKHIAADGYEWDFYGKSFVFLGQDCIDELDSKESMLCVEIRKDDLDKLKEEWGFRL